LSIPVLFLAVFSFPVFGFFGARQHGTLFQSGGSPGRLNLFR
jgi:hypothetical protein